MFLSVVQRDPQINRSTESMLNANDLGLLRVTKETSDGIYLSGAKMIGTASPYSNDLLIYPLTKLTDAQKRFSSLSYRGDQFSRITYGL